eukprot:CAMPEP_0202911286 /NCGR_PEP_ID=MMETSP1392-20130828/54520_1 /ASSEMBLY_ACC=CAM_ASM_000868 /TAXON_ID=225041 /ORGANISM="Chlamydomonas chlamydogama, Strain SAG 11-48b" /LENGTH=195 /DNA_ID=CAMNT_0049601725 /DNA_START=26 /DNA_END=610 /DNA_ORIENTATION=-
MASTENNPGPLWHLYSEIWVGRRLQRRSPKSYGTVMFGPFINPDSLTQTFMVKWSNEKSPRHVSVEDVRRQALPEFADEDFVPPVILELQQQGWRKAVLDRATTKHTNGKNPAVIPAPGRAPGRAKKQGLMEPGPSKQRGRKYAAQAEQDDDDDEQQEEEEEDVVEVEDSTEEEEVQEDANDDDDGDADEEEEDE